MSELTEPGNGVDHDMNTIEYTYNSLLADVGCATQISSMMSPAGVDLDWCVNMAPKLEKDLLNHVTTGAELALSWPTWLIPLRDRFLVDRSPLDFRYLRQVLLFCYKAEHKTTHEKLHDATSNFVACADSTRMWDPTFLGETPRRVLNLARAHIRNLLRGTDWRNIVPSHGPGAVTDYVPHRGKGWWTQWFSTIEYLYPYHEFFGVSRQFYQELAPPRISDEIIAALTAVPKDSRGPRLICVHPQESIWIQQGLRRKLEDQIESYRGNPRAHNLSPRDHVNFNDQSINGGLALNGSTTGYWATLDLKEASDRVPDILVQELLGPDHYKWFGCCRASQITLSRIHSALRGSPFEGSLPDSVDCSMYAPMGNATTFPIESLVFWALCVSTMQIVGADRPYDCYVFGDDIIVPSQDAQAVMDSLEDFNLLVNRDKSFFRGSFRESCGVDAFSGVDVTPLRWKSSYDIQSAEGLQSACLLAMNLRVAGYWTASVTLYTEIRKWLKRSNFDLPITNNPDHGGIAEFSEGTGVWQDAYWHKATQQFVSPILRLGYKEKSLLGGWNHLLSSLVTLEKGCRSESETPARELGQFSSDVARLGMGTGTPQRTVIRGARLKRMWTHIA